MKLELKSDLSGFVHLRLAEPFFFAPFKYLQFLVKEL